MRGGGACARLSAFGGYRSVRTGEQNRRFRLCSLQQIGEALQYFFVFLLTQQMLKQNLNMSGEKELFPAANERIAHSFVGWALALAGFFKSVRLSTA